MTQAKSNCWVFPNLLRLSGIVGMALGTTKIGLMISFISSAIVQLGGIPVLFAMRTHPQHGSESSGMIRSENLHVTFPCVRYAFVCSRVDICCIAAVS